LPDSASEKREGRCYELAFQGCFRAPEWTLVHGECDGPHHSRIGHAWLELDGMAYDPSVDKLRSVAEHARIYGAASWVRYSREDACRLMVSCGHYGPWDRAGACDG
jgi:hypothetical protein